ncbi:MAG: hypothetical protein M1393_03050 [Candidatus Thermoplasmatota archaeon]|nr:hypothetical protein [Candidatus Thermoplasmatota archaeon]MCL6089999.1 hypothetical protein [Candidatus Thermoplasmatota archaeon]MDA8144370.1 hypothetical protein [Thermoplasmatales archaeon]
MALSLFVLGILTAYFGSGKSRTVGVILLVLGLAVGIAVVYVTHFTMPSVHLLYNVILGTLFYVLAAVIGAVIGLLIFLGAIMKT